MMRSLSLSVLVLALSATADAQVNPEYTLFGSGCSGNGGTCASLNPQGGQIVVQTLPNEYCYPVVASTNMTVVGFNLFTGSVGTTPTTVMAALYMPSASNPAMADVVPAATGRMNVGVTPAFYATMLDQPVNVTAGQTFWIGAEAISAYASNLTSGAAPPSGAIYWRRPPQGGTAWAATGIVRTPSFQIVCTAGSGGGALPFTYAASLPRVGQPFDLRLGNAAPNAPAFAVWGFSNTAWGPFALPWDMTTVGSPGCSLYVAMDTAVIAPTDPAGNAQMVLVLPNTASLAGRRFYNQWLVLQLGMPGLPVVASNAGEGVIGS